VELQKCIQQFPNDLRFRMLELVYDQSATNRESTWDFVADHLAGAVEPTRLFYQSDFIKLAARELANNPNAVSSIDRLLKIYPHSARLRFTLAEAYVRIGDDSEALLHYRWLTKEFPQHQHNVDFFKEVQESYLASWEKGLRARTKKKKKK